MLFVFIVIICIQIQHLDADTIVSKRTTFGNTNRYQFDNLNPVYDI